jgi:hypothetical protein
MRSEFTPKFKNDGCEALHNYPKACKDSPEYLWDWPTSMDETTRDRLKKCSAVYVEQVDKDCPIPGHPRVAGDKVVTLKVV